MKNNITELVFILDRSGSMHSLTKDTVGGFNAMIEKQKQESGAAFVTTVLFNGRSELLHDRLPVSEVPEMTEREYMPNGCTALLDAMGSTIKHIANIHRYARPEDVPEHTVFVITTDGMENASRHYTADKVREMVKHEEEKYGWEFIFLGANIDAVSTAETYGINAKRAVNYVPDSRGTAELYNSVAEAVRDVRMQMPLDNSNWRRNLDVDFESRGKK